MTYFFFTFTNVAHASVDSFVGKVNEFVINPLIVLLFGLAIVYFLFGVFQFISNQENEEKKTTGKNHMIWGIVGMVIMMGVFTILNIIVSTLGIGDDVKIDPKQGTVDVNLPERK